MKNAKLVLCISVLLLFLTSSVSYAQEVTEKQYLDAYMTMYGSYLAGDEKFSKQEVEDIITYYLTAQDLSGQLYMSGPESGRMIGSILADAGVEFDCGICNLAVTNQRCCIYRIGQSPVVYECMGNEVKDITSYIWKEVYKCTFGCNL